MTRLAALKDRYDPHNVFHLNHNIPAGLDDRPGDHQYATSEAGTFRQFVTYEPLTTTRY